MNHIKVKSPKKGVPINVPINTLRRKSVPVKSVIVPKVEPIILEPEIKVEPKVIPETIPEVKVEPIVELEVPIISESDSIKEPLIEFDTIKLNKKTKRNKRNK